MKEATKRAASEALAQTLAVTASPALFFIGGNRHCEERTRRSNPATGFASHLDCFAALATTTDHPSHHRQHSSHDLVLAKYGTSWPANGAKLAVTLSPIERSLSPWAIMRKPSRVSTRTML